VAGKIVVGIGELLWDILGGEKHLGGAPANFAYHARVLGDEGIPVSRVGTDALGDELLDQLAEWGVPSEYVQRDPDRPTGTVQIELDAEGQPEFLVTPHVAWDRLRPTRTLLALAGRADAVCYGTLAQRFPVSRRTIRTFLAAARQALRVCDLNLRADFLDLAADDAPAIELVSDSLRRAGVLKLNEDEFRTLRVALNREEAGAALAAWLRREFRLRLVCVTRGARGCVLYSARRRIADPGVGVPVADTVGSGDAFTAAMVHGLLRRRGLADVAAHANRVGAYVASQPGATPPAEGLRRYLSRG
jgi:fructokinase